MDDPETPDIKMTTVDEILGRMKSNKLDTSWVFLTLSDQIQQMTGRDILLSIPRLKIMKICQWEIRQHIFSLHLTGTSYIHSYISYLHCPHILFIYLSFRSLSLRLPSPTQTNSVSFKTNFQQHIDFLNDHQLSMRNIIKDGLNQ